MSQSMEYYGLRGREVLDEGHVLCVNCERDIAPEDFAGEYEDGYLCAACAERYEQSAGEPEPSGRFA